MIKHVFVFEPKVNPVESERYYFRFHSKEVVRFLGPWLRRYETYQSYTAPKEAEPFGIRNGRLTELWYTNVEEWKEAKPYGRPYTPAPFGRQNFIGPDSGVTIIPAMPTDDFLGKEPMPEEVPILRWYQVFKYPDGVSREEGEKWYLNVHAKEVKEQPELLRFVSHRVLDDPPFNTPWHRVSELWFQDFDAWRRAIVEPSMRYTPPSWGGKMPFVDMISTFVGYKPDVDFLKDNPLIP